VNTCIIHLVNEKPRGDSNIVFNDCRALGIGDYAGKRYCVRQKKFLDYPDYIFVTGVGELLEKIKKAKQMVDFLDGGLGMHTTDNNRFLGIVDYNGARYAKNGVVAIVPAKNVDNDKWRFYHKKGGDCKYYLPAEYCLKWDAASRKHYKMPRNYNLDDKRQGFLISGVCSSLSARLATPGALWESNKAMCFFPKDPHRYPAEFFVGILNSDIYNKILKTFNHTNSIQIRDIKKLPFFDFNETDVVRITAIVKDIVDKMKEDIGYDCATERGMINRIVGRYIL
ncbi:MAG: hypothetical protein QME32_02360, partial [Endomicrobiia bacterium]|nr:hypothetical protein [Endomicrobiia bacterium]